MESPYFGSKTTGLRDEAGAKPNFGALSLCLKVMDSIFHMVVFHFSLDSPGFAA